MDSSTFNNLVREVEKESFASNQVDTIKTTIQAYRHISSSQVGQLLELLSFNGNKLEIAKMAYEFACDQGSYPSVVGGALSFSNTKKELNEYIRDHNISHVHYYH